MIISPLPKQKPSRVARGYHRDRGPLGGTAVPVAVVYQRRYENNEEHEDTVT